MKKTRNFYVGVTIALLIAVLAVAQYTLQTVARAQENGGGNRAGVYEVDRMWPKALPNNWVLGSTVGLAVDARDHVFIVHRGQATLDPKFASQMTFAPPQAGAARAVRHRLRRPGVTPRLAKKSRAGRSRFPSFAARRRRRCSSSTQPAISSITGAALAAVTSGRRRCTASPSMAKTTCGWPATAATRC